MQEVNVNGVKGHPMASSHTTNKGSNVTKRNGNQYNYVIINTQAYYMIIQ